MNKTELARQAVRSAARLRSDNTIAPSQGICPFDLAQKLGISVRLVSVPSLEGMYSPSPKPAIILSSERPAGRRRYTCAHEIGHHIFKHGYSLDQLDESNSSPFSPQEYIAQRFAGALLMPKLAIASAFNKRGWSLSAANPEQCFIVAQEFGVGFTTLLTHQELNLGQLTNAQADALRKVPLSAIRSKVAGFAVENDVFVVDGHWHRPSIDVEVGDIVLFPNQTELDGSCAIYTAGPTPHFIATEAGVCLVRFQGARENLLLRVSRRDFTGLARYRHLEEVSGD